MTSILEVEQLDTLSSNASSTITIGGTNTTTIAFGPNVTTTPSILANTPAFIARCTTAFSVPNNTWAKAQFNTEDLDTDNAYDNSNYRFTVPSGGAGMYVFGARVNVENIDDVERVDVNLYKNGSQDIYTWEQQFSPGTNNIIAPQTVHAYSLSVGDYIEAYVRHNEGTTTGMQAERNIFFGYRLIGA